MVRQVAFITITLLIGDSVGLAGSEDTYEKTTDGKKIAWMDLGKKEVKAK